MTQLLKIISISVLIIMIYCQCSKERPDNQLQYLKGKINGVSFECDGDIRANRQYDNIDCCLKISGSWNIGSITLDIYQGPGITLTPGTYVFEASNTCRGTVWMDNGVYGAGSDGFGGLTGQGQITITEINKEYVKGTFQFVTGPYVVNDIKIISDGQFAVKRQ